MSQPKEKLFRVKWEIDYYGESPLDAIRKAILAFPSSDNEDTLATVFDVADESGNNTQIDVLDEGCNPFNEEDLINHRNQENEKETV